MKKNIFSKQSYLSLLLDRALYEQEAITKNYKEKNKNIFYLILTISLFCFLISFGAKLENHIANDDHFFIFGASLLLFSLLVICEKFFKESKRLGTAIAKSEKALKDLKEKALNEYLSNHYQNDTYSNEKTMISYKMLELGFTPRLNN